jgi:hypothetical protein
LSRNGIILIPQILDGLDNQGGRDIIYSPPFAKVVSEKFEQKQEGPQVLIRELLKIRFPIQPRMNAN